MKERPTRKQLVSTSKFLSLILRHQPEKIGLQLDANGWLDIDALICRANEHGKTITLELLHEVVAENDKQRFTLSEDGLRIRANQGHSVRDVNLDLPPAMPPQRLYHGTIDSFWQSIRVEGLLNRSRNHVHLSDNVETAIQVGKRRGQPVLLEIDAAQMHNAGCTFYLSENKVWLTDAVPVEFIRRLESQ